MITDTQKLNRIFGLSHMSTIGLMVMDLKDDVIKIINTIFEKNNIDIKFESMFLFRPVVREPPFEKMEVIRDRDRLLYCDPICTVFLIDIENRRMEYEAEFKNYGGKMSLKSYKLRYCDYFPNEDPKKIEGIMAEKIKFVLIFLSAIMRVHAGAHASSEGSKD